MSYGDLNWFTNFIWGIDDDAPRDLYVRGKYRDVILPMMVLRRLDAVLEPNKQAVLSMKGNLDKAGITNQDAALRQAAGQAFYNTSRFTLRDLRNRVSQSQLTSRPTSVASRLTCRKFSTISNSATRSPSSRRLTCSER
jgi:type I restriction enzyme M protein